MAKPGDLTLGRESHGGDSVAVELIDAIRTGINLLKEKDRSLPISEETLEKTINSLKVIVTNEELSVEHDGNLQISSAINYYDLEGYPVIQVNRSHWNNMTKNMKNALGLHEILSLHSIERSFVYKYSSRISREFVMDQLNIAGFECRADFNKLTTEEFGDFLGKYSSDNRVTTVKFFVDYLSSGVKYILEHKSKMLGTFTTSDETRLCYHQEQERFYIPVAYSLIELERVDGKVKLSSSIDSTIDFKNNYEKLD